MRRCNDDDDDDDEDEDDDDDYALHNEVNNIAVK